MVPASGGSRVIPCRSSMRCMDRGQGCTEGMYTHNQKQLLGSRGMWLNDPTLDSNRIATLWDCRAC